MSLADDDLHWMRAAMHEAEAAFATGDWPAGAVVVRNGRLVGAGRNRQVTRGVVLEHAETDAIRAAQAAHGPQATKGATLYATMEPCPMCAGAMKLAGIARVVLALRHATLRRTDLGGYGMEAFCAMTGWHPAIEAGPLHDEYLALRLRWGGDTVAPAP